MGWLYESIKQRHREQGRESIKQKAARRVGEKETRPTKSGSAGNRRLGHLAHLSKVHHRFLMMLSHNQNEARYKPY